MKMLVVGAGSVGGFFGGQLAAKNRDVTFLVRDHRARQLEKGLTICSEERATTIPIEVIATGTKAGPFDVILLAVKAYQLAVALDDLAPYVGGATMILPVLNGMSHIEVLRSRLGAARVIGGVAILATSLDEKGWIQDQGGVHYLAFGEWDGARSERLLALKSLLDGAGFESKLSGDIEREMWEKWAMLAGLGAVTCLLDGNIGEVARASGKGVVSDLFEEITATIAASWKPLSTTYKAQALTLLTNESSRQTSSMFRDLRAGHRIEADQIIGDLIVRAGACRVATPLLEAARVRLKVYENRLSQRP